MCSQDWKVQEERATRRALQSLGNSLQRSQLVIKSRPTMACDEGIVFTIQNEKVRHIDIPMSDGAPVPVGEVDFEPAIRDGSSDTFWTFADIPVNDGTTSPFHYSCVPTKTTPPPRSSRLQRQSSGMGGGRSSDGRACRVCEEQFTNLVANENKQLYPALQ